MSRSSNLSGFIDILEREIGFLFDNSSFDSRLKIQKYVYLAKKFSDDLNYSYNLYAHGP